MNRGAGLHRATQAGSRSAPRRKRPIQVVLAALLVIPLVSLITLWAFAAESAVASAIDHYGTDTVDKDVGTVTEAVVTQVDTERADTYLFQAGHGVISRANLTAQRAQTDVAINRFEQGLHAAFSDLPTPSQNLANVAVAALGRLSSIRAGVDGGRTAPLNAFASYDAVTDAFFPFAQSAALVGQSVTLSELVEGDTEESLSAELIAREFPLALAAMTRGGVMTAGEQRLFAQSVDEQRLENQLGSSPQFWQQIPDPYTALLESKTFGGFQAMEDQLIATAPGKPVKVDPTSWNQAFTAVEAGSTQAQDTALLGIRKGAAHAGDVILFRLALVGGLGLIGVALSVVLLLGFGRRIAAELRNLRRAAHAWPRSACLPCLNVSPRAPTSMSRQRRPHWRSTREPGKSPRPRTHSPSSGGRRSRRRSGRRGCARGSATSSGAWPGATSPCCSASSGCWTRWSGIRRTPACWRGCSSSTT